MAHQSFSRFCWVESAKVQFLFFVKLPSPELDKSAINVSTSTNVGNPNDLSPKDFSNFYFYGFITNNFSNRSMDNS